MPSTKTALQVRFEDNEIEVLRRLAKVSRVSMASVVKDLFVAALPTLERVVVFAENAQRLNGEARKQVAEKVEAAANIMLPKLGDAIRQSDIFFGQVESEVSQRQGALPAASGVHSRRGSSTGKRGRALKRAKPK